MVPREPRLVVAAKRTSQAPRSSKIGNPSGTTRQYPQEPLVGVRAGRLPCYDRFVIDVRGFGPGGGGVRDVYYGAVYTQGQGLKLALAGGASLDITLSPPNYNIDTGFDTFRQVAYGGSFERYTTIGLGVWTGSRSGSSSSGPGPGPGPGPGADSRLVIDVAHR